MDETSTGPATAGHELRSEHRIIERVLRVLGRILDRPDPFGAAERAGLRDCVSFFRLFADACHHGKEEDMLFPVLERNGIPREGGPIGCMLHEHTIGRALVKEMGLALETLVQGDESAASRVRAAGREYITMLTGHIYKEDNILFAMGARVVPADQQAGLCRRFCEFRERTFEGHSRQDLEALAGRLESAWA